VLDGADEVALREPVTGELDGELGSGMPISTSGRPILNGPSAPMRTSAAINTMAPMARAWPVTPSSTGIGKV
jgi:hypothetical protein